MDKKEIVKKGSDWNNTKLKDFICAITDNNFEFKGDYEIQWKINKSPSKNSKANKK